MVSQIVVLLFAFVTVITPSVALAGNPGFWFNGGQQNGNYYGVEGNIESDPVEVYRDVSAWIMVAGPSAEDYIQVGWGRTAGQTSNWHFYQWSSASTGEFYHYETGTAPSGTYSYKLDRDTNNIWWIYVNGSLEAGVSHSLLGWTGSSAQFYGEVHDDTDDQSPGTVADPITMGYLKVKSSTGTWSTVSLDEVYEDLPHQDNNASVGDSTFEQWDNRY